MKLKKTEEDKLADDWLDSLPEAKPTRRLLPVIQLWEINAIERNLERDGLRELWDSSLGETEPAADLGLREDSYEI
jgi:hypothetical protein